MWTIMALIGKNPLTSVTSLKNLEMSQHSLDVPMLVNFSIYVLLRLCVQNRRKKWNFPLNFRTMRKLSELYSGIFQNY